MKDFFKKVLRFIGIGAIWLFLFSIPIKGRFIFDRLSEGLVPYGLVSAIGAQIEKTWYSAKAMARNALSDGEAEKQRRF